MKPELQFDELISRIRMGPDPFTAGRQYAALSAEINEYGERFPRDGEDILRAILNYFFSRGTRPWQKAASLLRRTLEINRTPDWLRMRCLAFLAYLTLKDPGTTLAVNFGYRSKALRLARKYRAEDQVLAILNSWLFACVTVRRYRMAWRLVSQLEATISSVAPNIRNQAKFAEVKGRLLINKAKLLLSELNGRSLRRSRALGQRIKKANHWYQQALRLEGGDTNRRVNILTDWADLHVTVSPVPDLQEAFRHLEKAERSIDSQTTNLTRAYFYQTRGNAYLVAASDVQIENPPLSIERLRVSRLDLKQSIALYRKVFHPLEEEGRTLLREVEMRLSEYKKTHPDITHSLARFRRKHPDPARVAFVMMRFSRSRFHREIFNAIRVALSKHGIRAVRADQSWYHDDLLPNVLTYMHGSGFGIAVFERVESEQFNPNVALEVGYMLALMKPVCFLKEESLSNLQTDLLGRLYMTFNIQDVYRSIEKSVSGWLRDKVRVVHRHS